MKKPNLYRILGLEKVPWPIRVYLVLLVGFTVLIPLSEHLSDPLFKLAIYAFKAVLVGLLAALSLQVKRRLADHGSDDNSEPQEPSAPVQQSTQALSRSSQELPMPAPTPRDAASTDEARRSTG